MQEIPVPAPADPETVTAFLKQFRSLTPHPGVHDFEALTHWWLNNPNPLTYQQALGMSDDLVICMAKYTEHYRLHQWEPEDSFLRMDFNEDFAKIDSAIACLLYTSRCV